MERFEITVEDRALIVDTQRGLEGEEPADPDPRILELYSRSSFAD